MSPPIDRGLFTSFRSLIKRALRGVTAARSAPQSSPPSTTEEQLRGDEGTALDKLIDGKSIKVADFDGGECGYVIGWTSRRIPPEFRPILWHQAGRLELEAWREMLRDRRRRMPDELTMIFWEDLPLAVWIPAGHVTKFKDFNPN